MRWDRIANAKANLSVDVGLLLRYHLSFVAMRFSPPEFPSFLSRFLRRKRAASRDRERIQLPRHVITADYARMDIITQAFLSCPSEANSSDCCLKAIFLFLLAVIASIETLIKSTFSFCLHWFKVSHKLFNLNVYAFLATTLSLGDCRLWRICRADERLADGR